MSFVLKVVLLIFLSLNLTNQVLASGKIYEIKMIKDGFDTQKIVINQGDIIKFENNDDTDRWPASDIHPTHAIYPDFDPKQPLKPKESWQFQFTKSGTFRFHDHLKPEFNGEIEVTFDKSFKQKEKPKNTSSNFKNNLEVFFKKTFYKLFPSQLNKDLKTFNGVKIAEQEEELNFWIQIIGGKRFMQKLVEDSGGGSKIDCHQEAHLTGRTAYKLEGKQVFTESDFNCHSGYLHGAMEAFIAENGGKNLVEAVTQLCKSFNTDFEKFECLHGIGHGFTAYMDYDILQSLDLCRKLDTDFARRSCYGGVFMENILVVQGKGAVRAHETKWVSDDPHFPCNAIGQDYDVLYECYQMQTSRMLDIYNYNHSKVVEQCAKSPPEMIAVCYKSFGRDVSGQTLRDPVKIVDLCKMVPEQYFKICIEGAENVIIDFWGGNLTNQPQQLCNLLDQDTKTFCYALLGHRLNDVFGKDLPKKKQVCDSSEKEFINVCLNGSP